MIRELITDMNRDQETDAAARFRLSRVGAIPRALLTRLRGKQAALRFALFPIIIPIICEE